jgi:hypothetical protein
MFGVQQVVKHYSECTDFIELCWHVFELLKYDVLWYDS